MCSEFHVYFFNVDNKLLISGAVFWLVPWHIYGLSLFYEGELKQGQYFIYFFCCAVFLGSVCKLLELSP